MQGYAYFQLFLDVYPLLETQKKQKIQKNQRKSSIRVIPAVHFLFYANVVLASTNCVAYYTI